MAVTWTETQSGYAIDFLEPKASCIRLYDIAYHLAGINRYTGATRMSVAQHSVDLVHMVTRFGGGLPTQRYALLHDAHEAYMGDISAPLKEAIRRLVPDRDPLKEIADRLDSAIFEHFDIVVSEYDKQLLKRADKVAMQAEAMWFFYRMNGSVPRRDETAERFRPWELGEIDFDEIREYESTSEQWSDREALQQFLTVARLLGLREERP